MFAYLFPGRERRQSYTVHERPDAPLDRVDRAETLEFVKDGFRFGAFVLPLVWLATHRIWMGVLAYLAVVAAVFAVAAVVGLPPLVPALTLLAVHLNFGNEADEILRGHLISQGWSMVGQVTGTGPIDCERRFFDNWLPLVPLVPLVPMVASVQAVAPTRPTPTPSNTPRSSGILGNLFAPLKRRDRS